MVFILRRLLPEHQLQTNPYNQHGRTEDRQKDDKEPDQQVGDILIGVSQDFNGVLESLAGFPERFGHGNGLQGRQLRLDIDRDGREGGAVVEIIDAAFDLFDLAFDLR